MKYTCASFAAAGFNTLHFWEGQSLDHVLHDARKAGLQLIPHIPPSNPMNGTGQPVEGCLAMGPNVTCDGSKVADALRPYATDPNILGWYLEEEPTSGTAGQPLAGNANWERYQVQ